VIELPEDDDDLLAECDVTTFRAGGPGGQHQNTTDSAVRLHQDRKSVV
jgi:Protein chain release factor B